MTKSIFITGAGSGLGKGTAIGLAKAGHRIIASVEITRVGKNYINTLHK